MHYSALIILAAAKPNKDINLVCVDHSGQKADLFFFHVTNSVLLAFKIRLHS